MRLALAQLAENFSRTQQTYGPAEVLWHSRWVLSYFMSVTMTVTFSRVHFE